MNNYCVVVADSSRARLFTLEAPEPGAGGPNLVERESLLNPEHEVAGQDKYSSTRTGTNANPHQGPGHSYDDHRRAQEAEHERRFARQVAQRACTLAHTSRATHVVIAAGPVMLGLVRNALELPPQPPITVHELVKDFSKFNVNDLHQQLAALHVLPPRRAMVS